MIFNIIGIILSGGKSIRMGNNKFILQYNNQSFMHRSIKLLTNITENIIISINIKIYNILIVHLKIKDIENKLIRHGPLKGIYTIANFLPSKILNTFYIIIPIDMPLLQKYLLYTLYKNISFNYSIIYFYKYPLPILIKKYLYLLTYLNNIVCNKESLKSLIKNMKFTLSLYLSKNNKYFFSNINNPYDLYKLVKMDSL